MLATSMRYGYFPLEKFSSKTTGPVGTVVQGFHSCSNPIQNIIRQSDMLADVNEAFLVEISFAT